MADLGQAGNPLHPSQCPLWSERWGMFGIQGCSHVPILLYPLLLRARNLLPPEQERAAAFVDVRKHFKPNPGTRRGMEIQEGLVLSSGVGAGDRAICTRRRE